MFCVCRTLAGRTSTCCGLEWISTSPFVTENSARNIFCEDRNQSLAQLTKNGSSICTCKKNEKELYPNECLPLLNYTSVGPTCLPNGCPSGYRSYTTGTVLNCNTQFGPQGFHTSITLFETACQGSCLFVNFVVYRYPQCFCGLQAAKSAKLL